MKRVILGLALVTMMISCQKKETKVIETTTTVDTVEKTVPAPPDTTVIRTETTVDTIGR